MSSGVVSTRQSPHLPRFGRVNKAGPLPSMWVVLSQHLKRYYEPLRLPVRPSAISAPLIRRGWRSSHATALGLQHWAETSSPTCHPCYPGRSHRRLPLSASMNSGFPLTSTGSASPAFVTGLPMGSLALRPAVLPPGNLRPPITRTPLPGTTEVHGQLLGRDFNPQDVQLLLRTDAAKLISCWSLGPPRGGREQREPGKPP